MAGPELYGAEEYGAEEFGAEEFGAEEFGAEEYGADELAGVELYGADELAGVELYGAAPTKANAVRRAVGGFKKQLGKQARMIKQLAAQNRRLAAGDSRQRLPSGARIQENGASKDRELNVNFERVAIPAGGSASVTVQPQVQLFRGERLVIPELQVGQYFVIDDILVGKDSQLAGTGAGTAAVVYSEKSVGVSQKFDPCSLGMVINIKVRNIDSNPRDFRATLIGRAIF